jgi:hypothetical protein
MNREASLSDFLRDRGARIMAFPGYAEQRQRTVGDRPPRFSMSAAVIAPRRTPTGLPARAKAHTSAVLAAASFDDMHGSIPRHPTAVLKGLWKLGLSVSDYSRLAQATDDDDLLALEQEPKTSLLTWMEQYRVANSADGFGLSFFAKPLIGRKSNSPLPMLPPMPADFIFAAREELATIVRATPPETRADLAKAKFVPVLRACTQCNASQQQVAFGEAFAIISERAHHTDMAQVFQQRDLSSESLPDIRTGHTSAPLTCARLKEWVADNKPALRGLWGIQITVFGRWS